MDTDIAAEPALNNTFHADNSSSGQGWSESKPETDRFANLLAGMTVPQMQAVRHTEGPLLVLAGPGSGKTRVITRRIAYLIGCGIPSWQILAVTFTNKAAKEMRERTVHLLGEGTHAARGLTVTTFHALCARMLRRYADLAGIPGLTGTFVIYDTDDQTALLKRVLEKLNLSTTTWPPRSVLGRISAAKNELVNAEMFEAQALDFNARTIAKIYSGYQQGLRAANAVDFDDLLLLTANMLRDKPTIRGECQSRWRYLLIDEYQDTNRAQFVIASLIAGGGGSRVGSGLPGVERVDAANIAREDEQVSNICVVGDPDQSIYGWRGADITNILQFEQQFPGSVTIALGENFRSTGHIISAADALIRNNQKRKHKDLFTSSALGHKVEATLCRDEHHEARLVADWIKLIREESDGKLNWKDFAVFYRTNALSRVIEDVLRNAGTPYVIARGTAFYQREEVKTALAYLRVVANPADEVSMGRVINTPTRGLGDTTIEKVRTLAAQRGVTLAEALRTAGTELSLQARTQTALAKFVKLLDDFAGVREEGMLGLNAFPLGAVAEPAADGSLAELVERVIKDSGLEAMYKEQAAKSQSDADADRVDNLAELISSAREFEQTYDPASDPASDLPLDPQAAFAPDADASAVPAPTLWQLLRAYLERVALVADADSVDPSQGAVTLMTLHAAKGLEFTGVAMIGLEENLLPHSRVNENPAELEEERRLCFVGVTRAMRRLLMTSARYRTVRGVMDRTIPSRFLSELPREHVMFSDQSAFEEPGWDRSDSTVRGVGAGGGRDPEFHDSGDISMGPSRRSGAPARGGSGVRDARGRPLNPGDSVRHPQFGIGRVESITSGADARASVRFRQAGLKTLVLQYARLEKTED